MVQIIVIVLFNKSKRKASTLSNLQKEVTCFHFFTVLLYLSSALMLTVFPVIMNYFVSLISPHRLLKRQML